MSRKIDNFILTPCGKEKWSASTVKSILTNEKYKGDALLQKKFTVDFLTKKQQINEGQVPQYYVENSHPAIITPEEFDFVQSEFQKRCVKTYSSTSIYATKIICGDCGSYFGAKVWHSNSKYRRVIYQCNSKFKGDSPQCGEMSQRDRGDGSRLGSHFCTTPHLYESEIQQKFLQAFAQYFSQKDAVIKNCQFALNRLKKQESRKAELQDELVAVNEKLKEYIQHGGSDFDTLNAKYEELSAKLDAEETSEFDRKRRIAKMQKILQTLKKTDSVLETFDESVWNAVLENLTVFHDGSLVFLFRDGTEVKV